ALMAVGRNASSNTTTPSGWNTIIASQSNSNLSTAFFWRRMTSSESNPSVTFGTSMSQSNAGGARIYLFRGCTTDGTPFEDPTGSGPTSNTSPSSATVDTTGPDRLVVSLAVMDNDTEAWVSGF